MLNRVETGELSSPTYYRRQMPGRSEYLIGILTDSVAAISGLTGTPTVGSLNVYSFSSTGVEDTGVDQVCYNFAPQAATTDRWTGIARDSYTGKYFIDFQACT